MPSIPGLTPQLDTAVRAQLRPGEELWYAGMPKPSALARRSWPTLGAGLVFGGFASVWVGLAIWMMWFAPSGGDGPPLFMKFVFPLFGLPFLAIGVFMVLAPVRAALRARRTAYCVTSHRAMVLTAGREIKVLAWSAEQIGEVSKTVQLDGYGTVDFGGLAFVTNRFESGMVKSAFGAAQMFKMLSPRFEAASDAAACEEALLALRTSVRPASTAPQASA